MINLKVNDKDYSVDVASDMPILWVLRDVLRFMVLKLVAELVSAGHGFCKSGQVISALAFLNNKADPLVKDIDAIMNGNICRSALYQATIWK